MGAGKEIRQWRRFGMAIWALGIVLMVIGFPLSQMRETYAIEVCTGSSQYGTCLNHSTMDMENIHQLAWVGYLFVVLSVADIIGGFIVYFILSSDSALRREDEEGDEEPEEEPSDPRRHIGEVSLEFKRPP